MAHIDDNLLPQEAVLARASPHPMVLLPSVATVAVCLIAAALTGFTGSYWPLALLLGGLSLVCLLFTLGAWLSFVSTEVAVTNRRVALKVGFFRQDTAEIALPKVESVQVRQGLLGRALGYGDVIVHGTGGAPLGIAMLADPLAFRRAVMGASSGAPLTQTAAPSPAANVGVAEALPRAPSAANDLAARVATILRSIKGD